MKVLRKTLAILISLAMVFEAFAFVAFAEENGETITNSKASSDKAFYYVALGDSIAGGYGLNIDDEDWIRPTMVRDNYKNSDPRSYPNLIAEGLKSYLKDSKLISKDSEFGWSNLGMTGFKVEDYWKLFLDPNYQASFFDLVTKILPPETEDKYHFHDFYIEELKKADLITLQLGANNLLWGMRLKWLDIALDGKSMDESYKSFLGIPVFDVGKNGNPAIVIMLCYMIVKMLSIDDKPVSELIDVNVNLTIGQAILLGQILYYTLIADRKLTLKDINNAISLLKSDKLEEVVLSSTEGLYEDYNKVLEGIKLLNPDAKLVIVNQYAPFGSSLKLDGMTRDLQYVLTALLNGVEQNFNVDKNLLLNLNKFKFDVKEGSLLYNEFWGSLGNIGRLVYQTSKNDYGRKTLLRSIILSKTEKKKAMLNTLIDTLTYPVLYKVVGKPTKTAIFELNSITKRISEERNLPLVDIYEGMPNEANIDPHPMEEGHKYIASQVLATLKDNNKINLAEIVNKNIA